MRLAYNIPTTKTFKYSIVALTLLLAGCSLEKRTGVNRVLQNLTAHYNYLFNANELLRAKQDAYALSFIDSYGDILNVYQDTTVKADIPDADLEAAKLKANTIISEKEQSRYVADAYLVLGKAYFLQGNYFNATEYLGYVTKSFPDRADVKQEACVWQARALLYLNNTEDAKVVLDTAFKNLNPKKDITADVYATQLQYDIKTQEYAHAEEMATKAIGYANSRAQRLRWTFILGQLQELNGHNDQAIASYSSIANSNASFEMAFNADLNRIRMEDMRNGVKMDRVARLLSLLKEDNNADFKDQIYYQVGNHYAVNKNFDNALKYYDLSVRASQKNLNQKGLAYLRIADIDFKERADYVNAKKYYDSTLTALSPSYPGYKTIQKKSNNLQLLVDKLQIIAFEDTLQSLAKMDEAARLTRIDEMVTRETLKLNAASAAAGTGANNLAGNNGAVNNTNLTTGQPGPLLASTGSASSFYFNNNKAISQGFNDFKRRWGNRKLEDNWRRSNKISNDNPTNIANTATANIADPDAISTPGSVRTVTDVAAGSYRQKLMQNLPLTPDLVRASNQRVYNAILDIANFYRDILEDKKEAIIYYEMLAARFPNDGNNAAAYYNLYRLYSDNNVPKSNSYRDLILKNYPESIFAKVLLDPEYARKLGDNDAMFNGAYNQVFDLYRQKRYSDVVSNADILIAQYPNSRLLPQLYYLRAVAAGHMQNYDTFRASMEEILNKYPDDRLIGPLTVQHIAYLEANKAALITQPVVLTNSDTTEIIFSSPMAYRKENPYNRERTAEVVAQVRSQPIITQTPAKVPVNMVPSVVPPSIVSDKLLATKPLIPVNVKPDSIPAPPVTQAPVKKDSVISDPIVLATLKKDSLITPPAVSPPIARPATKPISTIFNLRDSSNYYFVVNVSTGTTDLSSSRFGIGQFNRTHFNRNSVVHRLKPIGTDVQLIYVGHFNSLAAVKDYARAIIPIMPDIMKVPKEKYSFFIITKENLDKLADKKLLDSYNDFYQQTY